jgi:transcription termination/antitermination protein NusA
MNKDLIAVFEYLEREKGIKRELVVQAIEESLQAAARKSVEGASNVRVTINHKTGDINVYCEKEIVDEVEVASQEISIEVAREIDPDCEIGQFIDLLVTPKDFGRIAAQKARQIITQKLREAERNVIYEEYRHRTNELVSGTVKRAVRGNNLIVDLGKVEAIMPMREYPKTEHYQPGDKIYALLMGVYDTENGGAEVILSRSSPDFVRQLFVQEVPEINEGIIIIDKIVREAGYRTKITVHSTDFKVDPVGSCVGVRGGRVKNVIRELKSEKIDIIPHSDEPIELLQNSLSPLEVKKANINEEDKVIAIVVQDDDFANAVGKKGVNLRLTGQLVGYKIEIQKLTDYNRTMLLQREELASSEDSILDEPLTSLEGISHLVFDNLVAEGLNTPRRILQLPIEKLKAIPGISGEIADRILDKIENKVRKAQS